MWRNVTTWHVVIVLVVVLLLFGANRLPGLARSLGQSMKIFKSEVKDLRDDGRKDAAAGAPDPVDHPVTGTTDAPPAAGPAAPPRT